MNVTPARGRSRYVTALLLLGLGAGLGWGAADFFAGLQARQLTTLAVTLWSQAAGTLVVGLALALVREPPRPGSLLWGLAAGAADGVALLLFYRGLATGMMSIVAPVAACGALVPVVAALLTGQVPGLLAGLGICSALGGILLVSVQRPEVSHPGSHPRSALLLALGAAIGYGTFLLLVGRATESGGTVSLWTIAGARVGALVLLAFIAALRPRAAPWPPRRLGPVAAIGLLDALGMLCFALAAARGNLGIAAVLSSLGPAVTVVLGRLVLGERLSRLQSGGIFLALCGVVLLSTA